MNNMNTILTSSWWTFFLRGIISIAAGVLIIVHPASLIFFFGIYMLGDGVCALLASILGYGKNNQFAPTWWLIIMGVAGILAGIATFKHPGMTIALLVLFSGAWTLSNGVFTIFGALGLPKGAPGKSTFMFSGLLSILFGIIILSWPLASAIGISWAIAGYAIFIGLAFVSFALQLRSGKVTLSEAPGARQPAKEKTP